VKRRGRRPTVGGGDANQQVLRLRLRVLDDHVEVTVVLEHARIDQLVLRLMPAAPRVGLNEIGIGEGRLRVLIEVAHVRVRGRAVEIKVVFLDVLAVVAFRVGETEQAFLEDRIGLVPQRQ
jgi:hypothetical protein